MKNYFKKKIAKAIDTRKYDWIWEKIQNTYVGYYVKKILMSIMGISEDFAIRDIVSADDCVLKTSFPDDNADRFSVLLIQLPLPANRKHKRILPMGIASLAAYLRAKLPDIDVGILDAQCQNMNQDQIANKVSERKWNLIGISYWSVQQNYAERLSLAIRKNSNDAKIVHGGIHATIEPERAMKYADFVVFHEGEQTFYELVASLKENRSFKDIKGIIYKKEDGQIVKNQARELLDDLNQIPMPAYDLLPIEKYKMPLHVTGGDRLPLMGSRGCPYQCSFCTSPLLWQKKVRWRDALAVVDEIEYLKSNYGVSKFHFWDDNFTLNPTYVKNLCKEILDRNLSIEWVALDRAEHINRNINLLPIMKKSGCIGIELGLESANPDTFSLISKDQGIDESKKAIVNLRNSGICPLYTCMVFNPGESILGYYMQKEFLDKAQEGYPWHRFFHPFPYPLYLGQFATPYKGTKFHEDIEKQSMVFIDEIEDRFHHQVNTIPYSLLNDVPLRTIDRLDEELYILFINAVKIGFWIYFPGDDSKIILSEKLYDIWRFITPFFKFCDGSLSVKDIALKLSKDLEMDRSKAFRLTAFAAYVYGQVGVIRSAANYTDYKIVRKHIKIPLSIKLDILSLLKNKGIGRKELIPFDGKL